MTASEILAACEYAGFRLTGSNGALNVKATRKPATLPDDLRAAIASSVPDILKLLSDREPWPFVSRALAVRWLPWDTPCRAFYGSLDTVYHRFGPSFVAWLEGAEIRSRPGGSHPLPAFDYAELVRIGRFLCGFVLQRFSAEQVAAALTTKPPLPMPELTADEMRQLSRRADSVEDSARQYATWEQSWIERSMKRGKVEELAPGDE